MNLVDVKEKATPDLMAIPGVVGVGVSEIHKTIVVYVEILTSEIAYKLPKQIEGYPVEVLETGLFEALKW